MEGISEISHLGRRAKDSSEIKIDTVKQTTKESDGKEDSVLSLSDVEIARSDCFKSRPIRLTMHSQTTKSKSSKSKSSGKSVELLNPLLIKK